jgi:type VI secretion system protein
MGLENAGSDEQLLQSVLNNLNHLLNTKKGYGSFVHDFGIRDMNEYSSRQQLSAAIMEEVRTNIENYEPRLEFEAISLVESSDNFRIAFKIKCKLRASQQSLFMEFNSIGSDCYVRSGL